MLQMTSTFHFLPELHELLLPVHLDYVVLGGEWRDLMCLVLLVVPPDPAATCDGKVVGPAAKQYSHHILSVSNVSGGLFRLHTYTIEGKSK